MSHLKKYLILLQQAVEEKKNEKREMPLLNFTISGDGSWKKRGFSSLYGVTTLIAYYSGKVIDLIVKESYCQTCIYYKNDKNNPDYLDHEENCVINHKSSAGKMEVDAVTEMFLHFEHLHGVRYRNYVGDGDAKTFSAILKLQPYGEEFEVKKKNVLDMWKNVWALDCVV